jgi:cellulose biosynthesis protein BcsQ
MSVIIATCNQKGEVGKTALTINLGAALAEQGRKVLLIDLDPQGHLTEGVGMKDLSPVPYEKAYQAASCRGFLTPIGSLNNIRIVSNARRRAP